VNVYSPASPAPATAAPIVGSEGPIIDVRRVTKRFGAFPALDDVSVFIGAGEFFSLLGPSGCGKTTLLRLLAGFDDPTEGTIAIAGQPVAGVPPNRRPTNMVFQSYAIFPHLSVAENVGYGLRWLRLDRAEHDRRVGGVLSMVALSGLGSRRSHELSGGQRQRVALARALVMHPKVLLLDEPLSALDKKLRERMHVELRQLQRAVGVTFVLVTHDQEEALTPSDRLAVMFRGRIAQVDRPEEIYQRPASREVAEFLGGMNFLSATVTAETPATLTLAVAALGAATVPRPPNLEGAGRELTVGVRPERMTLLVDDGAVAARAAAGRVLDAAYYGDMTYYSVALEGLDEPVVVSMRNAVGRRILRPGETVGVGWAPESLVPLS
jgi:spermidine/putrescine transport system ATP-binding protein